MSGQPQTTKHKMVAMGINPSGKPPFPFRKKKCFFPPMYLIWEVLTRLAEAEGWGQVTGNWIMFKFSIFS